MTPFAESLVEAIGRRLAIQQGHAFGDYHRYYAEEILQEIAPIINAEVARIIREQTPSPQTRGRLGVANDSAP